MKEEGKQCSQEHIEEGGQELAAGMWEIPADCGQTETFLSSRNSKSTLNLIDCLCC